MQMSKTECVYFFNDPTPTLTAEALVLNVSRAMEADHLLQLRTDVVGDILLVTQLQGKDGAAHSPASFYYRAGSTISRYLYSGC
jgi:hypothetical protein